MQHFTIPFDFADDTYLESEQFDRLLPAGTVVNGVKAIYKVGAAQMGSVAVPGGSIYKTVDGTGGNRDYRLHGKLTWLDASGTGRAAGLGVRVSVDGEEGYFAVVDSALGAPVVYLYRRRAGLMVELASSPVSAAPLDSTDLDDGIVLDVRIETKADSVNIVVTDTVSGTTFFDHDDTDTDRIESWGFPAIYFGPTCTDDDVRIDDLTAEDFESEAEDIIAFEGGIGLIVNGKYYAEWQWVDLKLSPMIARTGFLPTGPVGVIMDLRDAHEAFLKAGDRVAILQDGTYLCEGVLRKVDQDFNPPEGTTYEIIGVRDLGSEVPIRDPDTGGGVLGFNQDTDAELYHAGRASKTIGEALAYVWDNAADGDDGLRIRGAAPATGDLYVQAELDLLDLEFPRLAVSGNVQQAEETLIAYMPEFGIWLDPETKIRHIRRRDTASFKDIDLSTCHAMPVFSTVPSINRTVVIVRGVYQESQEETFRWENGAANDGATSLQSRWESELQKKIEDNKKWIQANAFDIAGFGTTGGYLYIDLDLSDVEMALNEWRGTDLFFYGGPQLANSYRIKSNTATGRIVLTATAWTGGTPPDIGDRVRLQSAEDSGGLPNGFDDVGRAFELPGGKTIAGGVCGDAVVTTTKGARTRSYKVKVRRQTYVNPDTNEVQERIKLARNGVVVFDPEKDLSVESIVTPNLCGENPSGDIGFADTVEITLTVHDPEVPTVPEIRKPALGWEGTAFSFDSDRWGTGRGPGVGDVGVMTPHIIEDSNFTNVALQGTEYEEYAQHVLNALSPLARQGTIVLHGIDVTLAALDYRIRVTDPDRTLTGLEDATDLWPMQVEYDLLNETSTIAIGTMASGNLRLDAYRQRFAEKTRLDVQQAIRKRLEELAACMNDSQHGATGAVGEDSPTATPSCRSSHTDASGKSKPVSKVIEEDLKPKSCSVDVPPKTCETPECSTIAGEANMLANATAISAFMGAATGKKVSEVLCFLASHLAAIWPSYGGVLVSLDKELHKAGVDLGNVRVAGTALATCVNTKVTELCAAINAVDARLTNFIMWVTMTAIPTLQACLATKVDGSGEPCVVAEYDDIDAECDVVGNCEFTFTETVCEEPCQQVIPNVASGLP